MAKVTTKSETLSNWDGGFNVPATWYAPAPVVAPSYRKTLFYSITSEKSNVNRPEIAPLGSWGDIWSGTSTDAFYSVSQQVLPSLYGPVDLFQSRTRAKALSPVQPGLSQLRKTSSTNTTEHTAPVKSSASTRRQGHQPYLRTSHLLVRQQHNLPEGFHPSRLTPKQVAIRKKKTMPR